MNDRLKKIDLRVLVIVLAGVLTAIIAGFSIAAIVRSLIFRIAENDTLFDELSWIPTVGSVAAAWKALVVRQEQFHMLIVNDLTGPSQIWGQIVQRTYTFQAPDPEKNYEFLEFLVPADRMYLARNITWWGMKGLNWEDPCKLILHVADDGFGWDDKIDARLDFRDNLTDIRCTLIIPSGLMNTKETIKIRMSRICNQTGPYCVEEKDKVSRWHSV